MARVSRDTLQILIDRISELTGLPLKLDSNSNGNCVEQLKGDHGCISFSSPRMTARELEIYLRGFHNLCRQWAESGKDLLHEYKYVQVSYSNGTKTSGWISRTTTDEDIKAFYCEGKFFDLPMFGLVSVERVKIYKHGI